MRREVDREDYALLLLIERMQREGRGEEEIEAAVREAAPGRRGGRHRTERRPSRFELTVRGRLT